jgi:anti-sigma factor RsiW
MLTCQGLSENATAYMEGALPPTKRLSVWTHLRLCPACRRYLQQLRLVIGLARHATHEPPPDMIEEKLMLAFRQKRGGGTE